MKASTIVTLALVGTGASYVGYRALRPSEPNYYNSSTRPYGSGSGYRSHTTWVGGGGYGGTSGRSGGSSYDGGGNTSGTSRGGFGSTGHSSSSSGS
jgi:hypothetical protein